MSRTFHHGDKAKERSFGLRSQRRFHYDMWTGSYPLGIAAPPKKKRYQHHWEWMNTPGWWIKEMMNQPHRAKTNMALKMLSMLNDIEDAPIFPHPKKPHQYYW